MSGRSSSWFSEKEYEDVSRYVESHPNSIHTCMRLDSYRLAQTPFIEGPVFRVGLEWNRRELQWYEFEKKKTGLEPVWQRENIPRWNKAFQQARIKALL